MRTTAIMNLKGGTGKTITAINLAANLAKLHSQRVMLADADSQGNLTEFTEEKPDRSAGMSDLLRGRQEPKICPTTMRNVSILKASDDLMELDVSSAASGISDPMALRRFRSEHETEFDWMIIDCPPAFTAAATAALIAADDVVIPMKLDAFGIRGMKNLLEQIRYMRKVNPDLALAGILPTMFYDSPQMRKAETELRGSGLPVFHHIRRSIMVDDSTFAENPLIVSSPKSGACRDYKLFTRNLWEGGADLYV